jgi:hypothetical protein
MLSARGSPEATLCGNFHAPLAAGRLLAAPLLPPHALRPAPATDTVIKLPYFRNCRRSMSLPLQ